MPDEAELKAFGLRPEDFAEQNEIDIWPDNFEAVKLFADVSTQWRIGFGGATGLDYSAVCAVMKLTRVKKKRRQALLADIAVLEAAALEEMYKDIKHV